MTAREEVLGIRGGVARERLVVKWATPSKVSPHPWYTLVVATLFVSFNV